MKQLKDKLHLRDDHVASREDIKRLSGLDPKTYRFEQLGFKFAYKSIEKVRPGSVRN